VLASQPPEIQRFLLVTSILERLTAPLCDSILKIQEQNLNSENLSPPSLDSRALLEHLERENLFLVPLDDERSWYRYHHLFADLLRAQLQKSTGDRAVAKLHQYASEWYEQNGLTLDAIHHASLIPDFERMERLIEQNYVDLVNRKEMTLVRFWMGKLNEELVYRRPWLCLYEALNRSWFGNLEESALYLSIADKYIQSADPTPDTQAMIGYRSYVQSRNTALRGDTRRAIEYCLEAREKTPSSNHGLHVEIGITLGYEYFLEGDFTNAKKVIDGIIQLSEELRAVNTPVAGYALLARIKNILGRLHDSQALYQKSSSLVESAGGQYLGATGITEVGIAALFCEWNDLETALVRMKKGLSLLPMWGKPDDLALAYTHLFRIQLALGDRAEAGDVIEKAARLVQSHSVFPEARNALEASQVKLWLLNEDWPAIDRWVASLPDRGGSRDSIRYADEIPQITLARVFIFQNKYEDAVRLLSGLEESARAGCRGGRLIEVMILKALALQAMGKNTQAIAALTKSLELAQPEGYVRLFLDERQPMRTLLTRWAAQAEPGTFRDYAVYLLSQFEPVPEAVLVDHKKPAITGGLVEPLSPRELEVLALIAEGKTNREIARQLVVALGTVKAHAASIYRKLDVTNRTEAVARARQLGFLT
jgi:LuxR family maltose regulon positive regulatory protein